MTLRLSFLGAAGTVTGSRYLVDSGNAKLLVDCGLFQGYKPLRLRNWTRFPVDPPQIGAVVLTHAHLDHSGYLPLLVRNGFRGPIVATTATRDLADIILRDSGHLQEREAEHANFRGYSKHHPALPLYTEQDAERALKRFDAVPFDSDAALGAGVTLRFRRAGHILGAAMAELEFGGMKLLFSGDLGRASSATMLPPVHVARADYLIVESTYGNRTHVRTDPLDVLAHIITRTIGREGTVLIPAFAVGRTQELLYYLAQLKHALRVPRALPVIVDSPMAIDATRVFCAHLRDHRLTAEQCREAFSHVRYVTDTEASKALGRNLEPKILLSASGMATGGRVLYHLERLAPDPRNSLLFAGFQAGGTRGAAIVAGAQSVKIHGAQVPIRAEVHNLDMLSAHADADEIVGWLKGFERAPRMTFITHGEPAAAEALRVRVRDELDWPCSTPDYLEEVVLEV